MSQVALDSTRVRRLVHSAGVVVVALSVGGLWLVPPAVRAQEPSEDVSVEVTRGPQEGAILRGDVDVVVEGQASAGLEELTVVLAPVNENNGGWGGFAQHGGWSRGDAPTEDVLAGTFLTDQFEVNGVYHLTAEAIDQHGRHATDVVGSLRVDNPPDAPHEAEAWVADDGVHLCWAAPPQHDVRGYVVERADAEGPYTEIATVHGPPSVDRDRPGSRLGARYRVVTVRHSVVHDSGIQGPASAPVSASSARSQAPPPDWCQAHTQNLAAQQGGNGADNSESTSTDQVQARPRQDPPSPSLPEPGKAFREATEPPAPAATDPATAGSAASDEPDSGEAAGEDAREESGDQLAANLPADKPDGIAPKSSPATTRSFGGWWLWLVLPVGVGATAVVVARGLRRQ